MNDVEILFYFVAVVALLVAHFKFAKVFLSVLAVAFFAQRVLIDHSDTAKFMDEIIILVLLPIFLWSRFAEFLRLFRGNRWIFLLLFSFSVVGFIGNLFSGSFDLLAILGWLLTLKWFLLALVVGLHFVCLPRAGRIASIKNLAISFVGIFFVQWLIMAGSLFSHFAVGGPTGRFDLPRFGGAISDPAVMTHFFLLSATAISAWIVSYGVNRLSKVMLALSLVGLQVPLRRRGPTLGFLAVLWAFIVQLALRQRVKTIVIWGLAPGAVLSAISLGWAFAGNTFSGYFRLEDPTEPRYQILEGALNHKYQGGEPGPDQGGLWDWGGGFGTYASIASTFREDVDPEAATYNSDHFLFDNYYGTLIGETGLLGLLFFLAILLTIGLTSGRFAWRARGELASKDLLFVNLALVFWLPVVIAEFLFSHVLNYGVGLVATGLWVGLALASHSNRVKDLDSVQEPRS